MLGSCFHDLTNTFKQAPEDDGSSPAGEDARQKKEGTNDNEALRTCYDFGD
jgi:hypothetical protein